MGKIQVGQKSPKTIDMGGFTVLPNDVSGGAPAKPQPTENKNGMTAEEKAKQIEDIMQLPQEQIVPELRKRGFNEIADVTEAQMKQEKEKAEKQAESRAKRLAEIKAMDEAEQLPLLLEEGFNEEAKELSEKLAGLNGETADHSDTDNVNEGGEENADTDGDGQGEGDGDHDADNGDGGESQVQQETETPPAESSVEGETSEKENKEKSAPKRGGRKSK